jgi:hypothetical protein
MQVGRVRFARIEGDDDAFSWEIDFYILNPVYLHERCAQLSHAFIAILALGRDFYRFQNGMIGAFGIKRVARVGIGWSRRVHRYVYLTRAGESVVVSLI